MVGNLGTGAPVAAPQAAAKDKATLEQEERSAKSLAASAKNLAANAKDKAAAERAAGNSLNGQGAAQSAQGAVSMGLGGTQAVVGGILIQQAATNAVWTCGGSQAVMLAGITMMIAGAGQMAQGAMQMSQGNEKIAQGTTKLASAAQEGIISTEQAGVANKEMIRSQIFKSKIEMMEGTMQELNNSGKLKGSTGEDLSQEQLEKLKSQGTEMFDKGFAAGADAIKNGGIMSIKDGDDSRYFIQDKDGKFGEVNVVNGTDGKPQLDDQGRLQIDTENPATNRAALSDDKQLELVFDFAIMNQMKDMITGHPEDLNANPPVKAQPPLARIEIDPKTGEVKKSDFNLNNPQHMKEFADLVAAASKNPPPLKYDQDEKGLYFQKWDWTKGEATSDKVYVQDMAGGTIDKNDPNWKTKAKSTAAEAFKKAGLGEDSDSYKLLKPLANEAEAHDASGINVSKYLNYLKELKESRITSTGTSPLSGTGNNSGQLKLNGSSNSLAMS